jgi:N-acyl amino acid synthase of PEP-CTERM/exosortase system
MNDAGESEIAWRYAEYFDIVRADTRELLDEAYRLRYQVYCLEHPFEKVDEHVDGRERDVDDDRSVHTLLLHRQSGAYAGTVRTILPREARPLPIQRILVQQGHRWPDRFPLNTTVEISRFAVSKEFRRRRGEERYPDVNVRPDAPPSPDERKMIPYITFGLIRGVVEVCGENDISHISAVMEPALIRILGRFGIHFQAVGSLVEHHGMRQPCVANIAELIERNRAECTLLWQYTGKYVAGFSPHASRADGGAV